MVHLHAFPTFLILTSIASPTDAWQRSNSVAKGKQNNSRARSNARRSRTQLPSALERPTRGGYTSNEPHRRRLPNLFSTSVAAPQARPHQSSFRWDRHPFPTIDYDSKGDMIDGDLFLPSHLHEEQQTQQLPTYVENLKEQVARASREAEAAQQEARINQESAQTESSLTRLDAALFGTYFCNSVAVTIPVILMPLVAAEHVAGTSLSAGAVVATLASISTLGGGLGKVLNGFVCQGLGGSSSSFLYLLGLSAASLLLSVSPSAHAGGILALIEFLASIQWTACSLVLANHYQRSPKKFAKGITILSLASTSGTLLAKMGGTALLKFLPSWRSVAQLAGITALVGAGICKSLIAEEPSNSSVRTRPKQNAQQQSVVQSFKAVVGNPLFWQVGIAHATAMLARTSDRILGSFFHQTTDLPRSVCGGLTTFVTIGFVHGLIKGRSFHQLVGITAKTRMLSKAYSMSALSAVAMAICSNDWIQSILFPSKKVLAATMSILTSILASNISFQFYQLPAMAATGFFGKNKALCISLFDGLGFFFAGAVWKMTGTLVESGGQHGWTLAWLMLAAMFGAGGKTMLTAMPSVLQRQQQQQRKAAQA